MNSRARKTSVLISSKTEGLRRGPYLWVPSKMLFSQKHIADTLVKRIFGNLAKTRAIRKGKLLRGMVSQGRPDPLRHCFKVVRSDSAKLLAHLEFAF